MTGPPGLQGAKEDTGAQRPSGQKRERGDGTSGVMFYKNWKECAWKDLNDDKDNGLIKVINICRKQKLKLGFSLYILDYIATQLPHITQLLQTLKHAEFVRK